MPTQRGSLVQKLLITAFGCVCFTACTMDDAAAPPDTSGDGTGIPTGNPNGATDGSECGQAFDCKSGVCSSAKCAIPTGNDGVRNGGETGLDCGGPAPPCAEGQPCVDGGDCVSGDCREAKCTSGPPATSADGKKNGDETDVDCGGKSTNAPACADNKGCKAADDCESHVCADTKKCAVPSPTDTVKNGDETDIDCGGKGATTPRCDTGKHCLKHEDCDSDGCDDQKKCANGRSCTQLNGGRTCGEGEVGDPNKKHESCCGALAIPGMAGKLDKYKVTTGRMRAFIERVNGDVQGWYNANKANLDPKAVAQIDPWVAKLPVDLDSEGDGEGNAKNNLGVKYQMGGYIFLTDRPSGSQGCYVGNTDDQGFGSHTYFNDTTEGEDRGFDQATLDAKALNCTPYPLMAAFCAWDGGRLQTWEENNAAFGAGVYPWGNAPPACGVDGNGSPFGPGGSTGDTVPFTPSVQPGCDTTRINWLNNYQFPEGGNGNKGWDLAYYISAPGRFPLDVGPGGHKDIGGVMMELTASPGVNYGAGTTDPSYGPMVRWSRAGSWEGHQINYGRWQFAVMTKYGKVSGRCARD